MSYDINLCDPVTHDVLELDDQHDMREPRRDGRRERPYPVHGALRGAQQGEWSLW